MFRKVKLSKARRGFTLVELTIVLVIVALMIGGMIVPLSTQFAARKTSENERLLAEIRDALIGYTIVTGRLPCPMPTTLVNPADSAYGAAGSATATGCLNGEEGFLPWKTLGVAEVDAWGQKRSTSADLFVGYWRYRVHANFASTAGITSGTSPGGSEIEIVDHSGNRVHVRASDGGEPPVAVVLSYGPKNTGDGENADLSDRKYETGEPTATFDDSLIWLARPYLFSRLAAAGKLN
jgi:prepilin-type N-terminal cleavage/methylation domain-containing protein